MSKRPLGFWVLTALVVGNMVGSGIFMLPRDLAKAASPEGVLFAWLFTGIGVWFLALVFGRLAINQPEYTGGPQAYAQGLFIKGSTASYLSGYLVSWGYWVANIGGIVAILTSFAGYLSTFLPVLNSGVLLIQGFGFRLTVGRLLTFIICSMLLWGLHYLISKGVEGAGNINLVATIAKVAGFLLFIIATLFVFQKSNLLPFFVEKADPTTGEKVGLFGQINHAAISTLWAFIGIESAVVFSSRAKRMRDVKRATFAGLVMSTLLYVGISLLVMGVLKPAALTNSTKPLVDALTVAIGAQGGQLLAFLALICLFGSAIGWILLSAEVPYQSAKKGMFMKGFMQENKNGSPSKSLTITNLACQVLLFSTLSNSIGEAFTFVITIATLSYLLPYIVASMYQIKWTLTAIGLSGRGRWSNGVIGGLATLYSLYVIVAGTENLSTFLWGVFFIVVGIIFFPLVLKNRKPLKEVLWTGVKSGKQNI
ncbi:amino acid permease [Camelliibacillus cellulosilyticus]|uniref:Amino acid permease n=1 Tax=Camelliibacillus cellulosilyticus TaxID=2174486 RepID=A0ABV9GS15_9BACL